MRKERSRVEATIKLRMVTKSSLSKWSKCETLENPEPWKYWEVLNAACCRCRWRKWRLIVSSCYYVVHDLRGKQWYIFIYTLICDQDEEGKPRMKQMKSLSEHIAHIWPLSSWVRPRGQLALMDGNTQTRRGETASCHGYSSSANYFFTNERRQLCRRQIDFSFD